MSDTRETTARRLFEDVWNRGRLEVIDQIFSADHVNHDPVNPGRGRDQMRAIVEKYRTAFPDCRFTIEDLFSAGDRVVVRFAYSGTQKGPLEGVAPTQRRITGGGILIAGFSGNVIRESHVNWDALGMMQQLGVVTMPGKRAAAGR